MSASLIEWGTLLKHQKNQLQAWKEAMVMEKRTLVVIFEDFMKQDIENDVLIDRLEVFIDSLDKRANSLDARIANNEYAYSRADQHLRQAIGQLISKCPFGVIVLTEVPTFFFNFCPKAELLQVSILFPHPFTICMRNLITKEVGNRRN